MNQIKTQDPTQTLSRRQAIATTGRALAAAATVGGLKAWALPELLPNETLVPFLDMPRTAPNRLDWETLNEWITPADQVFNVQHYGIPEIDPETFELEITGLVRRPMKLKMSDLSARAQREIHMTLECSGNGSSKGFMNAVYNGLYRGADLGDLLKECGVLPDAREIVFFGADEKEETLRKGTRRELKVTVPFGRSMSIKAVQETKPLLCQHRNGTPLELRNGAPLRLIVPGWYGVANVKWLTRIDVRADRYMGRYMARDYVTVRGEQQGNEVVYVESSVSKLRLKSIVARVHRRPTENGRVPLRAMGAAWGDGTEITGVEVKVDDGPWRLAALDPRPYAKFSWRFFSIDLGNLAPGKHTIVSRAIDANGRVQPSADDDEIALKRTYWEANQQWPREIELS
jgi:DMSO/TMAO reductase YedYZ molybdopterin-dependent catalytic subunit